MIRILKYGEVQNEEIFSRVQPKVDVQSIVREIIENVKENKDRALLEYTRRFDGAELSSLAVSKEEIGEALLQVEDSFWRF